VNECGADRPARGGADVETESAALLPFVLTAIMTHGAFHSRVEVDQTKYLPDRFGSVRWRHVVKRGLNASTKTLMIETGEAAKGPPTTVRSVLKPRFRSV